MTKNQNLNALIIPFLWDRIIWSWWKLITLEFHTKPRPRVHAVSGCFQTPVPYLMLIKRALDNFCSLSLSLFVFLTLQLKFLLDILVFMTSVVTKTSFELRFLWNMHGKSKSSSARVFKRVLSHTLL